MLPASCGSVAPSLDVLNVADDARQLSGRRCVASSARRCTSAAHADCHEHQRLHDVSGPSGRGATAK
jgi:hypothetical protein